MAILPKVFLKVVKDYYELIVSIYKMNRDLSEAELLDFIKTYRDVTDPQPSYIFKQLLDLKIIRSLPDATASYEVTYHIKNLLDFLEQEHRFTSPREIMARLEELDSLQDSLRLAFEKNSKGPIFNILNDMAGVMEKLREGTEGNRLAIIQEVRKVRSNVEKHTSADRYGRIDDIYKRYVLPLEDMIEVGKVMDMSLDKCEKFLSYAAEEYCLQKDISYKIKRVSSHLPLLRREVLQIFQESLAEITPLLNELRDNLFARGVTVLLDNVSKRGADALTGLADELALPSFAQRIGVFEDFKSLDYLKQVDNYQPVVPPKVDHGNKARANPQKHYVLDGVLESAKAALPLQDTLGWLVENYKDKEMLLILRSYNLLAKSALAFEYGDARATYSLDTFRIHAHPLTITNMR
ncbi:hypothetical protein [Desulfotalea psychrophila]|uniref:Uncharacterized protein n=1 Tax=Desulfotalea psychrophila (strain LSv54 / DSM 12343) TaxID=177439 RepID=Q6AK37_DESPS|nr:hypothetical protein [Desulfotalea psychrophila]CAG37289.1 hypothetical protein DP2560 [Desulfotalea psychrophila LSv54]